MTANDHISVKEYPGGVNVIDSDFHREHMAGCYLVEAGSEVAFIEVGTNSSTPRLMTVLKKRGRKPQDVRYVIVTHVHLPLSGKGVTPFFLAVRMSSIASKWLRFPSVIID